MNAEKSSILIPDAGIRKTSLSRFYGVLCDQSLIWLIYGFYYVHPYFQRVLGQPTYYALFSLAILLSAFSVLNVLLAPSKDSYGTRFFKALHNFLKGALAIAGMPTGTFPLSGSDKKVLLFTLVKFFFLPVMVEFCLRNYRSAIEEVFFFMAPYRHDFFSAGFFNEHLYKFLLSLIFFVDTLFFAFSYAFEAGFLKNRLRSVDSTFSGWAVALLCYPPFNSVANMIAPGVTDDYAWFYSESVTAFVRIFLLLLMLGYLSATLSLGFKCSNLTNRGIVKTGLYGFIRHPAYICKNLFWWITIIPLAIHNPGAIIVMMFWSLIYFSRAWTEERHLLKDPEYREYYNKVKYRFIPGVY